MAIGFLGGGNAATDARALEQCARNHCKTIHLRVLRLLFGRSIGLGSQSCEPPGGTPGIIYVCSHCLRPTFFEGNLQQTGVSFGGKVEHITADVDGLYNEARKFTSAGAYTAAVLACRELLMRTAVDKDAESGKSFMDYVEYLSSKGYITPDAKGYRLGTALGRWDAEYLYQKRLQERLKQFSETTQEGAPLPALKDLAEGY